MKGTENEYCNSYRGLKKKLGIIHMRQMTLDNLCNQGCAKCEKSILNLIKSLGVATVHLGPFLSASKPSPTCTVPAKIKAHCHSEVVRLLH